jgi:Fanconi anemia group M protein
LKNTALTIFDEAHHGTGDYPYTMIADEYVEQNPDGTILGLTASPGASKNKITLLCQNLHIPLENIHIRTRKDSDVRNYLKPMDVYKVSVNLTELMEEVYAVVLVVLEERLKYLSQLNFLDVKSDTLHDKIIRKDLLRLNKELVSIVQGSGNKTGVYSALSINAQALILYHMLELIEQQGLDVLLKYLEKVTNDARKKSSSKAVKILASDTRIRRVFIELKKNQEYSPEQLIHPKFQVLIQILLEELNNNPRSRMLVFVKLRDSVKNIVKNLKDIKEIEPVRFVGQATKAADDKGLSQKKQIEILEQFKEGKYNVLVSTNVGEEGLDIAECDLVVFYDVVASEIRLIQRKGRTARHRRGRVVILYCKGTHDEVYLRIALSKLKKMNINLKNPQQLKDSYNEEFLPDVPAKPDLSHESLKTIKSKGSHQSRLFSFIEPHNKPSETEEETFEVKISRLLPMKFGIRKKLEMERVEFSIVDSDLHIVIFNKVLIQVCNPRQIIENKSFISENKELAEICKLFILVFDFIDLEEEYPGEKSYLKKKVDEIKSKVSFQTIPIENEEELYFILKSILETVRAEGT